MLIGTRVIFIYSRVFGDLKRSLKVIPA